MAGTLNVDTLKADSNLRLQVATANVAYITSSGLNIVGGNLIVGGSTITSAQLSQINANGTISAGAIASVNANTITSGTIPLAQVPQLSAVKLPAGTILQAVSTTITGQSTYTGGYADITGMSVSITPSSATSKILLIANLYACNAASSSNIYFQFTRGGTAIGVGTSDGNYAAGAGFRQLNDGQAPYGVFPIMMQYLDSPGTTSSTTYKVQTANNNSTTYINYSSASNYLKLVATLTAFEVAA